MSDQIRYDILTQHALRAVVRDVLADVAKNDKLPGDHHFYISFDTHAEGVRLSDRLRSQYPQEMTIILQHQYWGLSVTEQGFEVGLSFGGIPEKLAIPFAAITEFVDPSVQFGLRFETVTDAEAKPADETARKKKPVASVPATPPPAATTAKLEPARKEPAKAAPADPAKEATAATPAEAKSDKPSGGGEVVRLDRFRKK